MKKLVFSRASKVFIGACGLLLVLSVLFFQPALAQSGPLAWSEISSPGDRISSVNISPDNFLYVTRPNILHISFDQGVSWSDYPIPFPSVYVSQAVFFQGRLYISCEEGIISSAIGQDWRLDKAGYGFPAICASEQYLFIFGIGDNSWRFDGVTWSKIKQAAEVIAEAVFDNNALLAVSSGSPAVLYRSHDNGQTWLVVETLDIHAISLDASAGQHDIVGFTPGHKLSSRGQYSFDYSSGYLMAVDYFDGLCLVGGSENLGTAFYRGLIFADGDLNTATYFDAEIVELASNDSFVVANAVGSYLYIAPARTSGLVENSKALSFYPNPASGLIRVNSPLAQALRLVDVSGRLVASFQLIPGSNSLDISSLPSGMYFIHGPSWTSKVLKK